MLAATRICVGLAGAVVAVLLSACGSDAADEFTSQSANKIMDQAEKDTKALKSLHLEGTLQQGEGDLDIDLSADEDGNCAGTMAISGGTAHLLSVDGDSYLRGDEDFWKASAGASADQVIALLGDRWAKLPPGQDDFTALCDVDKLFDNSSDEKETYSKGKISKVGGKEAIEILVKRESGGTAHAWIATRSEHYLLKVEEKSGDEPGTFELSDFNEPVDAEAPAKDEYVDLANLGG